MKATSLLASFAAVFAASPLFAAPAVSNVDIVVGDALNGSEVTVTLGGTGAEYVYCDVTQDRNTARVYLEDTGNGTIWIGMLPPCHAGQIAVVAIAEDSDGGKNDYPAQYATIPENIADPKGLTNQRFPYIPDWPSTLPANGVLDNDWMARKLEHGSQDSRFRLSGTEKDETFVPAINAATAGGFILTRQPVKDGVGTIWFKAKMANTNRNDFGFGGKLSVERITRTQIVELATVEVPAATASYEWHQFHLVLQKGNPSQAVADQGYYRIRNKTQAPTSGTQDILDASIDIEDVVLTPLMPDVRVEKAELDYSPGYPSVEDPIEFSIAVSNCYADAPATHITPRLVWRQDERDPWTVTYMTNVSGRLVQEPGVYACVLDENTVRAGGAVGIQAGPFEYFYEVGFAGYTPVFPAVRYPGSSLNNNVVNPAFDEENIQYLARSDAIALMTDANGNINEFRGPCAYPDFLVRYGETGIFEYDDYGRVVGGRDVAPETAATNFAWGFERRFDLWNLDEGWPKATGNFLVRPEVNRLEVEPRDIEIPGEYTYLHFQAADGVRRFRSMYDALGLRVEDHDENVPSFMQGDYPMQQVGDYTWMAILHVTNAIDVAMAPTGACHYAVAEDGTRPSDYLRGPFIWWEQDQPETNINPPMSGTVTNQEATLKLTPRHQTTVTTNYYTITNIESIVDVVSTNYVDVYTNYYVEVGGIVYEMEAYSNTIAVVETSTVTNYTYEPGEDVVVDRKDWIVTNYVVMTELEGLAPTRVQIDYDGFLMYRYCTTNGNYQIRRAAWQDFNTWQADDKLWDQSYGLYDMNVYECDLEGSRLTRFAPSEFTPLEDATVSTGHTINDLSEGLVEGLRYDNGWVIQEWRTNALSGLKPNRAWRLSSWKGVGDTRGTLETTSYTRGDGRDTLSFRARASTDDEIVAYYDANGSENWSNYGLFARIQATAMSDAAFPYASVYTYWQDPENYIETRLIQKTRYGTGSNNNEQKKGQAFTYFDIEVWKCEGGNLSRIVTSAFPGGNSGTQVRYPNTPRREDTVSLQDADGWVLGIRLETTGATTTEQVTLYKGKDFMANSGAATLAIGTNNWSYAANFTISHGSVALGKGTIGFNCYDMAAKFNVWVGQNSESDIPNVTSRNAVSAVKPFKSSATGFQAVYNSVAADWEQATDRAFDRRKPWTFTSGASTVTVPSAVERPAPTAYFRILAHRTEVPRYDEDGNENQIDTVAPEWDAAWDEVFDHAQDKVYAVTGFSWQKQEVPLHFWDDSFLQIQALEANGSTKSTGHLVVDDLEVSEWCGKTVWYEDYADTVRREEESWKGTYAAIVADGREGRKFELSRSRANPRKTQSVLTPHLWDGVGDLLCSYQVGSEKGSAADKVVFQIELVDDLTGIGESLVTVTGLVSDVPAPVYAPALRRGISGRLRVVTLGEDEGSSLSGVLWIDDLRATDYPNTADTSWEAYNVLVSALLDYRDLKFDGRSTKYDAYRSAVLNDGTQKQTVQNRNFNKHPPLVQTPAIETGVGEVSFWYRGWPGNSGPSKIHLRVAKSGGTPDPNWKELSVDDLYWDNQKYDSADDDPDYQEQKAALLALSNIGPNDDWKYFSCEFYEKDYKVLRVMTDATEPCRAMVDNVIITEPVRTSIDVGSIEFDPGVPLTTCDTGVKVTLVNPRMGPEEIKVTLEYYVGTNKWGYEAWKDERSKGTVGFTNAADSAYVFLSTNSIPAQPADAVVQYAAVVKYKGRFASDIVSETQGETRNGFWFKNPWWYEPIDLNKTFDTTNQPVAHYWAFTVSTNQSFVNEVRPAWSFDYVNSQFVELMGAEDGDISGWTLHHAGRNSDNILTLGLEMWTNTMPNRAAFFEANNAETNKGWGFYVLGCSGVAEADTDLFPPEIEEAVKARQSAVFMYVPGALVLKRSMGAWADRVCWSAAGSSSAMSEVQPFIDEGYEYLGSKRSSSSAAFHWTANYGEGGALRWDTTTQITPGGYNYGQEEAIWPLAYEQEEKEVVLIGQPLITGFSYANGYATLSFKVATTNGIALTPTDYTWYVQASEDLTFEYPNITEIEGQDITADAEGNLSDEYTVTFPVADTQTGAVFLRVWAVPEGE